MQLCDLTFGYVPKTPVVAGATGQLHRGKLCALIGPNAAGKTTLLRLMLGQLRPWSGRVQLDGRDVGAIAPRRRAPLISYVPQQGTASFAFTVEQVVAMGRFAMSNNPQATAHAIEVCALAPLRQRVYATLSAGQQQRVMMARAMAQSAGAGVVMLLDEPVSAMDLRHVHRTMHRLTDLAGQGLAVLVVLHDLNLAARYAHDVWLMHQGRLIETGPWAKVLQPDVLQQVYGIGLKVVANQNGGRPVFIADDDDTIVMDHLPTDSSE